MLPGTNLTRTICRSAPNINWLFVDLEHGNISNDSMHEIVAAAAACGTLPIVRTAESQHWMIKRALDGGAHGIMVPMIENVNDATRVVEDSKFPPRGKRYGQIRQLTGVEYLQQADKCLNIDASAAIDGIDVLFIGPFDLSVNMGCLISGADEEDYAPQLRDAILRIYHAGKRNGKAVGVYTGTGARGKAYAKSGFQMINHVALYFRIITDMVGLKNVVIGEFEVAGVQ
ncbi:HpcH/HpaI aldolase family protein [Aspergillus foveolatus]|uniref:HpcH/HpaI aldolase family protein n=1 Tax=Aspergillus foveolatus TaxID=210207 RepID=UPI003CCD3B57